MEITIKESDDKREVKINGDAVHLYKIKPIIQQLIGSMSDDDLIETLIYVASTHQSTTSYQKECKDGLEIVIINNSIVTL